MTSLPFFDLELFLLPISVAGQSFMSLSLLVLELPRKYPSLSFAQYLRTGVSWDTKFGTSVTNEILLNATL